MTIEDETGWLNVIVWNEIAQRQRQILLERSLIGIDGEVQSADGVTHFVARRLLDYQRLLPGFEAVSRDFH